MARLDDSEQKRRRWFAKRLPYPAVELLALVNARSDQDPDTERTRRWWRAELAAHIANNGCGAGIDQTLKLELKIRREQSEKLDRFMREAAEESAEFLLKWRVLLQSGEQGQADRLREARRAKMRRENARVMAEHRAPFEPKRKERVTVKEHFRAALGPIAETSVQTDEEPNSPAWKRQARLTAAVKNRVNDLLHNWRADGKITRRIAHDEMRHRRSISSRGA